MKKLTLLPVLLGVFMIALSSCKRESEDRVPGDWDFRWMTTFEQAVNDGTFNTYHYFLSGTMSFLEGGFGIMTDSGDEMPFAWTATDSTITLDFMEEDVLAIPMTFDIIVNEKDKQLWSAYDYDFGVPLNDIYSYQITLRR